MALDLTVIYPGQVDDSDPDYPYGKARNRSDADTADGTPYEEQIVNDTIGFHQAILDAAGVDPSGDPDKVGASQYLSALLSLRERRLLDLQVKNWTRVAVSGEISTGDVIRDLHYNGYIYLVGHTASGATFIERSLNGDFWTTVTTPSGLGTDTVNHRLASAAGTFLLCGEGATIGNNIRRSTNSGSSWSTVACHAGTSLGYRNIVRGTGAYFATPVSPLSTGIGVSSDGSSWAATAGAVPSGSFDWGTRARCEIRAGAANNLIVFQTYALASLELDRVIYTVDNGANWLESGELTGADGIHDISYNAGTGKWIALATGGTYESSDGGATWSLIGPPPANALGSLANNGSTLWVEFSSVPAYSVNQGQTWIPMNIDLVTYSSQTRTIFGGGRFWIYHGDSPNFWLYRGFAL